MQIIHVTSVQENQDDIMFPQISLGLLLESFFAFAAAICIICVEILKIKNIYTLIS